MKGNYGHCLPNLIFQTTKNFHNPNTIKIKLSKLKEFLKNHFSINLRNVGEMAKELLRARNLLLITTTNPKSCKRSSVLIKVISNTETWQK